MVDGDIAAPEPYTIGQRVGNLTVVERSLGMVQLQAIPLTVVDRSAVHLHFHSFHIGRVGHHAIIRTMNVGVLQQIAVRSGRETDAIGQRHNRKADNRTCGLCGHLATPLAAGLYPQSAACHRP